MTGVFGDQHVVRDGNDIDGRNPHSAWREQMTKNALVVGLALATLSVTEPPVRTQKPGDGCALLQAAEIQVLAGTAKVGVGQASTDPLDSRMCRYEWGTGGNVQSGRSILDVSVISTSKAYPGTDASLLRQGLLSSVKAGDPNAAVIAGVGNAATYQSNAPIRVVTTALVKGNMLFVTFQSADARAKKDQVIALLKAAAGRL
jgi:hypothetical protein